MTEKDFILESYPLTLSSGQYCWSSPSNIALVKYWGKKEEQIPENPSVSFTLDACKTTTKLSFNKKGGLDNSYSFSVTFEGAEQDNFKPKIQTFFERVESYLPFLKAYHFEIETSNTFPHSSGIASSASGMSALALCLMSLEKELNPEMSSEYFRRKSSFLARLGSGSASRSIEGELVVWGAHKEIPESSNLYGTKYPFEVHNNFKDFHDTILLVDKGEKQVSSTVGHKLMFEHPFADERFKQGHKNLSKLIKIFKNGDLPSFIKIVESEALTLHAMMMTSHPYFILMKPNTLKIINKIWEFREETGLYICFTLDAGANVHLLYPENQAVQIYEFIKNELVAYCQNGHYICDRIGFGAKQLPI
ncbi:MAG: diphosphomevalonate decarboxylase [Bacteroidia bacterium]|nr:diphosphomevalonate decarboxylase [Bacteroidia bacterium]NND25108.1 diphosphomevalonate decarboxylase [Flavobacteriaceae bacterium]NNK61412.1 diphosphomevalonate decarboxylase [Flavobacteriaceae bacterium]NNL31573.1 diphosphomevalonate decarboxylase [Flavobacteriaceae bacterium]